jgi:hypothetical protein
VRSIVGAQAPLGQRQGDGVAHLRNETSTRSTGTAQQHQRSVGNVEHIHQMNKGEMNNNLAEGADDESNPRPAQCRRTAPRDGLGAPGLLSSAKGVLGMLSTFTE